MAEKQQPAAGRDSAVTQFLALARRRHLVHLGSLGLVTVIAAAAVIVPLALTQSGARPSPSASLSGESSALPSPSSTTSAPDVTPTPTPAPSTPLINAAGWPVSWPETWGPGLSTGVSMGPDGTIYVTSLSGWGDLLVALDTSGHERRDWLKLPTGRALGPAAFGPDGSIYVLECPLFEGCLSADLYAFDASGSLRYRKSFDPVPTLLGGPSGTLYVGSQDGPLALLGADGSPLASGIQTCDSSFFNAHVRPDGTLLSLCGIHTDAGEDAAAVSVYDRAAGRVVTSPAIWDGLTMGSNGTAVAWRNYVLSTVNAEQPYRASETRMAVIGADAQPAAGWPITVKDAVSMPVVASDGTVYVNRIDQTGASQTLAFRSNGQPLQGWPAALPAGYGHVQVQGWGTLQPTAALELGYAHPQSRYERPSALYPMAPVAGPGGRVYVAAHKGDRQAMVAFDSDASVKPGWPVLLPEQLTYVDYAEGCIEGCYHPSDLMLMPPATGSGLLYLHLERQILALRDDGQIAPGWPKRLAGDDPHANGWTWWDITPDGSLAVAELSFDANNDARYIVTRWLPDGSLAK